jgi:predicted TIM-barrel fold metal-dependent hydrolase
MEQAMQDHDPKGRRLPIKIDGAGSDEHPPVPLTRAEKAANRRAHEFADQCSKKLGRTRRDFLKSACGAAATLLAFNQVYAALGARGGSFAIPAAAAMEIEAAEAALTGHEFIMDMQNHVVDPSGDWATGKDGRRWCRNLTGFFGSQSECDVDALEDYSAEQLLKEVFMDSDTSVSVISALWGGKGHNPTPTDYAAETRAKVAAEIGDRRCLIHGGVLPNEEGQIEFMEVQARQYGVAAWKLYPQWGPDGVGFFMDDEKYGIPTLEKARELGVTVVASHRGLPLPGLEYEYSKPADIARVGRMFPDMTFMCYHSGYEPGKAEGPYRPEREVGVDRFIEACLEQGYEPNRGNVYAELGSVWRYCMSKPDQAAHLMGKLLKYLGEDRIVWGTDCLWYGSPQDQIQAMRAFEISEEFQEKYGYPPLTPQAKRKIFGLNAARIHGIDPAEMMTGTAALRLQQKRRDYAERANPSFASYGPRTRAAFDRLMKKSRGRPG